MLKSVWEAHLDINSQNGVISYYLNYTLLLYKMGKMTKILRWGGSTTGHWRSNIQFILL